MEVRDLMLDNQVIGKYIEVNLNEYDLKLVSRKMYGNTNRTVKYYVENTKDAVAGINGGLFTLLGNQIVGSYKDINNNLEGNIEARGTYILFSNNKISIDYVYSEDDIKKYSWGRSSAYYCFLRNGNYVTDSTYGYENNINKKDTRSMIGQKTNGNIILAVTTVPVNGEEQARALINLGCHVGGNLDGGGSRQLILNGQAVLNSTRDVPDALVVVKKTEQHSFTGFLLNTYLESVRIRKSVVNGTSMITVPRGKTLRILGFIPGFQSDGYQWVKSEYNGIVGYSQLDTLKCYTVSGPSHLLKIHTTKGKLRVRETPVDGKVLTTVPIGNLLIIESLIPGIQSDGYQWARVIYNGIHGYSQIDTKNWNTLIL